MGIKVPEGMLQAGRAAYSGYVTAGEGARRIIEAVLRWQKENPPVPTEQQLGQMSFAGCVAANGNWDGGKLAAEWVRRMYDEPELVVPEEIKDQTLSEQSHLKLEGFKDEINLRMIECFRRGQKAGPK